MRGALQDRGTEAEKLKFTLADVHEAAAEVRAFIAAVEATTG